MNDILGGCLMKRVLLVFAVAALGGLVGVQLAAGDPGNGNQLLGKGNVTYHVAAPGYDVNVSFDIHARGNGKSSEFEFSTTLPTALRSYDGSVCAGSYTDSIKGGTDFYFVGALISGPPGSSTYAGFVIHEGGPLGADYAADVLATNSLATAQATCSFLPGGGFSPINPVTATSGVLFKV
jgi:hypothetical protein